MSFNLKKVCIYMSNSKNYMLFKLFQYDYVSFIIKRHLYTRIIFRCWPACSSVLPVSSYVFNPVHFMNQKTRNVYMPNLSLSVSLSESLSRSLSLSISVSLSLCLGLPLSLFLSLSLCLYLCLCLCLCLSLSLCLCQCLCL